MELLIYPISSECNALALASLLRPQIASIHIKNYMLSSLRWDSNPGQTQANILPLYQLSYRGIYKRLQRESNSYLYCDRVASYPLDHAAKYLNSYFSSLRLQPWILLYIILQLRQIAISTCSHVSISFYVSHYNLQQSYSLTLFELGCIFNNIAIKLIGNIALNLFLVL